MKTLPFIIVVLITLTSCQNIGRIEKLESELEILKLSNDSLRAITEVIKDKYVFDSLTIRHIPHYKNTNRLYSKYKEEIVFAGYNLNGKMSVIIGDSLSFENGLQVINGDTLEFNNGGFLNILELKKDKNYYSGILQAESEFGKPFIRTISSVIQTKN